MPKSLIQIRKSQLITGFGPGSIVNDLEGDGLMILAPRHWSNESRLRAGSPSTYQRGKNVVSASSGKAMSSAPARWACSSRWINRSTTDSRGSVALIGPSWPAATVRWRGGRS